MRHNSTDAHRSKDFSSLLCSGGGMRIRRHAKNSPSLHAASFQEVPVRTHVCQLNQSPWDVGSFSPPSFSPEPPSLEADRFAGDGSFLHRPPEDYFPVTAAAESHPPILCSESDGKSWQYPREEHSLCDHPLSQVKSYSSKTEKQPAARPHRSRPKKAPPKTSSSNPNEFYYYSGFGPRWGKKRTQENQTSSFEYEHEIYGSLLMSDEFDFLDATAAADDDAPDDEDEDEDEELGKKRARKPIKARSLKSLM